VKFITRDRRAGELIVVSGHEITGPAMTAHSSSSFPFRGYALAVVTIAATAAATSVWAASHHPQTRINQDPHIGSALPSPIAISQPLKLSSGSQTGSRGRIQWLL